MTRNFTNHLGNMHDIWDKISFNAYRFDSAPLLPPPQGEGDYDSPRAACGGCSLHGACGRTRVSGGGGAPSMEGHSPSQLSLTAPS